MSKRGLTNPIPGPTATDLVYEPSLFFDDQLSPPVTSAIQVSGSGRIGAGKIGLSCAGFNESDSPKRARLVEVGTPGRPLLARDYGMEAEECWPELDNRAGRFGDLDEFGGGRCKGGARRAMVAERFLVERQIVGAVLDPNANAGN